MKQSMTAPESWGDDCLEKDQQWYQEARMILPNTSLHKSLSAGTPASGLQIARPLPSFLSASERSKILHIQWMTTALCHRDAWCATSALTALRPCCLTVWEQRMWALQAAQALELACRYEEPPRQFIVWSRTLVMLMPSNLSIPADLDGRDYCNMWNF